MSLPPGTHLGPYEVLALLGAGGMGEVYRARDTRLGRNVAIKVLPEAMAKDPEGLARFTREARAVATLSHPHIVTIYSTEEEGGVRFITMELVEGHTLDRLIPGDGLPLAQFFDIAIALADALAAAHEKQIMHRDLKPANVMVSDDGRVKVLDFGLARTAEPEPACSDEAATRLGLTQAGMILGTMPYMSPEQIEGKPLDHRTDIFSLGIMLYEMATGGRPFHGDSSPALMSSIIRDHPKAVHAVRPDVPDEVSRLVGRCLEKQPRDRIQTAAEIHLQLKAMRRVLESGGMRASFRGGTTPWPAAMRATDLRVAVLPFLSRSAGDAEALADGLTDDITAGLSRFPHLRVVSRPEAEKARGQSADTRTADSVGARYLLDGTVRAAGSTVRLSVRLVDAFTGAHLWAETYERALGNTSLFAIQDDITARVVATVADSAGVLVRSMASSIKDRPVEELTAGELVLRYFAYMQHFRPEEHLRLRTGLEKALTLEADHALGWACLSALYEQEYSQGLNVLPDSRARSAQAAERAVEIDPTCQASWRELATLHFFDRDLNGLRMAAERTIALNPLNSAAVAYIGMMLAYAGDWERGVPVVRNAMELNPQHPGWYHYVLVMDHYRKGEYEEALTQAKRANMPHFVWTPLSIAVAAGQLSRTADARMAFDGLRKNHPDYLNTDRVRAHWSFWLWDEEVVDGLMDGFAKAQTRVESERPTPSGVKKPASGPAAVQSPVSDRTASIAVLPFTDMSAARDQDWFCEGIAEEILNALMQLKGLRVAARTSAFSFKGKSSDLRTIGEKLNVTTVLEGSVRRAGDRVRITAQLSDVQNGFQLWSERYDRELKDIFDVQDEIAKAIAGRLKATLAGGAETRLVAKSTDNVEAYQTYLKGRALLYQRGPSVPLALQQFQKAVELDPNYALAWAGIADVYTVMGYYGTVRPDDVRSRALEAAGRSIELDPNSAEAHTALASALLFYRGDPAGAEREFLKSLELNPNYVQGRCWYALFYLQWTRGRFQEGLAEARRALDSDPLSSYALVILALCLGTAGHGEEAIAAARRSVEADPESFVARWALGQSLTWAGRPDEAVAVHREACRVSAQSSFAVAALATAISHSSHPEEALPIHDSLVKRAASEHVLYSHLALTAIAAGARGRALAFVRRAWDCREPFLLLILRHYPDYSWFRQEPESAEILRQIELPVSDPRHASPPEVPSR